MRSRAEILTWANLLFDRAYGRPVQQLNVAPEAPAIVITHNIIQLNEVERDDDQRIKELQQSAKALQG